MLQLETENLNEYLSFSAVIDFDSELVKSTAGMLQNTEMNEIDYVKKVYEYVRDEFPHSFDINGSEVSCSASDVIKYRHGICYAKSHLLAAILRCSGIPAGFCYQKLLFSDDMPRLVLHGLNAVFLRDLGRWIRLDARGNKAGVNAQFSVCKEELAFPTRAELGETDGDIIYVKPADSVILALTMSKTLAELKNNLPDQI